MGRSYSVDSDDSSRTPLSQGQLARDVMSVSLDLVSLTYGQLAKAAVSLLLARAGMVPTARALARRSDGLKETA